MEEFLTEIELMDADFGWRMVDVVKLKELIAEYRDLREKMDAMNEFFRIFCEEKDGQTRG